MEHNQKAEVIEEAIIAYIDYMRIVLVKGRAVSALEFFADYAHQLKSDEVHACHKNTMVNGCCSECGRYVLRANECKKNG